MVREPRMDGTLRKVSQDSDIGIGISMQSTLLAADIRMRSQSDLMHQGARHRVQPPSDSQQQQIFRHQAYGVGGSLPDKPSRDGELAHLQDRLEPEHQVQRFPPPQASINTGLQVRARHHSGRPRTQLGRQAGKGVSVKNWGNQPEASNIAHDYFAGYGSQPTHQGQGGGSKHLAAKNMASLRNTQLASALVRGSNLRDGTKVQAESRPSSQSGTAQGPNAAHINRASSTLQNNHRNALIRSRMQSREGQWRRRASTGLG